MTILVKNKHTLQIDEFTFKCCIGKKGSTKDKEISNESFFYVYDTVPRIYQYREVVNGMFEQFHRVYGVRRGDGKHILVEHFTQDGRLTETYDYLVDSMLVYDHMVVGVKGDIRAASLAKNKMFPLDNQEVQFKSIFPGLSEGFVLEYERIRKLDKFENRNILSKKLECLKLNERLSFGNCSSRINVLSKLEACNFCNFNDAFSCRSCKIFG